MSTEQQDNNNQQEETERKWFVFVRDKIKKIISNKKLKWIYFCWRF